ncbi:MAG: class I SAM-dependent methyltransferase, partial [Planctomycetia bacterium]|nr:class I SAM-dependent methyltransferase [Planctomycetia bacterium]
MELWHCKRLAADALHRLSPRTFAGLKALLHLGTGRAFKEDYLDCWTGRRDALTPPRRFLFDGTTEYDDFRRLGDDLLRRLIGHGLQPHHQVLEAGCGNGKNARALTRYLNTNGAYLGFDIVPHGVQWCRRHLTPRYPNFQFQHADIRNRTYHPTGRINASDYRFPCPGHSCDLVFLTSVFTHMLPMDVEHYVREIGRVLKPGGQCFASFFLLTPAARQALESGRAGRAFPFEHESGVCRLADQRWPEDAIAYDEA